MASWRYLWVVLAVLTAGTALAAVAELERPARIEGLRELGTAFKNVKDELESDAPQLYILQLSARQIRSAAKAQYDWFPEGSGQRPGVKTAAKPDIWEHPTEFKAAQDAFAMQADAFAQATASSDVDRIRAQAKLLGEACRNCHESFRFKDED